MAESDIKNSAKRAVGLSLGGAAGEVCMRTRCQDIIPRLLSGECKQEGRGRAARQTCRHLLLACQEDSKARERCQENCARFYQDDDKVQCERDCNLARCRVYNPYENCVAAETLKNVLRCMENGPGRQIAEKCLAERCGISSSTGELQGQATL